MQSSGGLLATVVITFITYASGWLISVSGWLGEAWTHVTSGQASLVIGLLTLAAHKGPGLVRWLVAGLRRRTRATKGG